MVQFADDFVTQQLAEGREFRTGEFFTGLSNGDVRIITIENPTDSGVYLHLEPIAATATGNLRVTPKSGVTVDTEGTQLDTIKLNGGSQYTPKAQPRKGDSISGGQAFPTEIIPSGKGVTSSGGALENGFAAMLAPGQVAAQEFDVQDNDTDVSLVFNWIEVDKEVVPVEQ